ncbi:MAG: serine hydrolase domain-containing protein [Myxococcota bacterium]
MKLGFCLLVLGLASACGGAPAETPPDPHAALIATLEAKMREGGIPGMAVALIKNDDVAWMRSFGYADLSSGRKVDDSTPFLLASLSKTVVAMVGQALVEEHKLVWEDGIDGPLGFSIRHPARPDQPITALELVTHTSGIIDDFIALGAATTNGDSPIGLKDFASGYVTAASHFGGAPGARFDYSNAGFGVLGAVVEGAGGDSLAAMSKRYVFDPIGMTDTGWFLRDMAVDKVAIPYSGTWEEGLVPSEHLGWSFYSATSLRSSIRDLSKYLLTFIRFGQTKEGVRVIPEASARHMREPLVPDQNKDQGLCWYWDEVRGKRWFGHTGSAVGASAIMFFRPEDGLGVLILTNSDVFVRSRLGFPAGREALYDIFEAIAAEGTEG